MKTIGLPISRKENENRRALIPEDIRSITNKSYIFIEDGYGDVLGYSNQDYLNEGVKVASYNEVLKKHIICDPKVGDAHYLPLLEDYQSIFGWIHAIQNREITDILLKNKITAYAWEEMFECGRHTFYRNNEIAGEAAVMHAFLLHGIFPYDTKVAVIGRGNIARGAIKILSNLGASIKVYDRLTENLLRKELSEFDIIVNAILWDVTRKDHIIYREDLKFLKKGAMIIDISCDRNGGVETCIPSTIENPIYIVDGITHYAVDHTPSLFYKTISKELSKIFSHFIDELITDRQSEILKCSLIIDKGVILDERIKHVQQR